MIFVLIIIGIIIVLIIAGALESLDLVGCTKVKTDKELLKLLRQEFPSKRAVHAGLCSANLSLLKYNKITYWESERLNDLIKTACPLWQFDYYWPQYEIPPRIAWIDKMIENCDKKGNVESYLKSVNYKTHE